MSKKKPARDAGPAAGHTRSPAWRRADKTNATLPARDFRSVSRELRAFAMGLPGATEDFPWGDRVAKVNGKVFVFLGLDPVPGGPIGLSLKLPASGQEALDLPFTRPTGYGLGKSGWVTSTFEPGDALPVEILKAWIVESYRAIAPKNLLARLEAPVLDSLGRRSRSERRGAGSIAPKKLGAALEGSGAEISQRPIQKKRRR